MKIAWILSSLIVVCGSVGYSQDAVREVAIGKPAPDFTMTGIDGNDIQLSQLTAEGKNVVLLFSRAHW